MTNAPAKLIFAGGGTGGHLYPAIAIADRVRELLVDRQVEIIFVGTERGIEYRIREQLGYPLHLINVRGLIRSFTLKNLLVPFAVVQAIFQVRRLLAQFRPDAVVGTGGYVSWPVLRTAAGKGIPTMLQEQNSFPGIATRKLASRARRIYLGFAKAIDFLPAGVPTMVTGNPVRRSLTLGDRAVAVKAFGLDPHKKTILVMGGSQGAHAINKSVMKSLIAGSMPDAYQLLWLTGKRDHKDVVAEAGELTKRHALFPFEHRMDLVYAAADLAISRAGALTLAELELCAVPSLLVPYPFAAGDHQRKNAEQFVAGGLGEMIIETDLDRTDILARAVALCESGESRRMHERLAASTRNRKPAVDVIAEDIIQLVYGTRPKETVSA